MKTNFVKKALGVVLSLSILVVTSIETTVSARATEVSGYGNCGICGDQSDASVGETVNYDIAGPTGLLTGVNASWSVSDTSVASISGAGDHATLTIKKNNSTVTVRAVLNGTTLTDEYETYQAPESATSVTLNTNSVTITGSGNTARVTVHISPEDSKTKDNTYLPSIISSDSSVATGTRASDWGTDWCGGYITITAHGSGSATITVKCSNGPSASCRVTVNGTGGGTTAPTPAPTSPTATNPSPATPASPTQQGTSPRGNGTAGGTTGTVSSNHGAGSTASGTANSKGTVSGGKVVSGAVSGVSGVGSSGSSAGLLGTVSDPSSDVSTVSGEAKPVQQNPAQKNNLVWIIVLIVVIAGAGTAVGIVLVKKSKAAKAADMDKTQDIYSNSKNNKK